MPDGVFNVVHGDKEAVDAILDHPDIKAVSFVGSTPIAQYVYTRGTAAGKRVQALGGAKNHMIVMPDADIDKAADALMGAGYGSAGERCMAISVAVPVGEETANTPGREAGAARARAEDRPGHRPGRRDGPARHRSSTCKKVLGYIDAGREGRRRARRRRPRPQAAGLRERLLRRRLAVRPRDAGDDDLQGGDLRPGALGACARRPTSTPSSSSTRHEYGNGTAIFTRDGDAARDFADRIEVGMVGINVPIPVPVAFHSFGGWKRSLFGDHAHLRAGGRALLHAAEDGHHALAGRHRARRGVHLPEHALRRCACAATLSSECRHART